MAIARAVCTCASCGRQFVKKEKVRNNTKAEEYREWAEKHLNCCDDCYREGLQEENSALLSTFPELEGTEKQVPWAEKIRAQYATHYQDQKEATKAILELVFAQKTDAGWWIDHRYEKSIFHLVKKALQEDEDLKYEAYNTLETIGDSDQSNRPAPTIHIEISEVRRLKRPLTRTRARLTNDALASRVHCDTETPTYDIPKFPGKMRMPTLMEYNKLVALTKGNDDLMHWDGLYSHVNDVGNHYRLSPDQGLVMGCLEPNDWEHKKKVEARNYLGFRPVFTNIDNTKDAKIGKRMFVGTLYANGELVPVPALLRDTTPYPPNAKLALGPTIGDPQYDIPAYCIGTGIFIADRCLLKGISAQTIRTETQK